MEGVIGLQFVAQHCSLKTTRTMLPGVPFLRCLPPSSLPSPPHKHISARSPLHPTARSLLRFEIGKGEKETLVYSSGVVSFSLAFNEPPYSTYCTTNFTNKIILLQFLAY